MEPSSPDVLGKLRQLHVLLDGVVGDGQDSHAQALVLNLMDLLVILGVTDGGQAPHQVILTLNRTKKKFPNYPFGLSQSLSLSQELTPGSLGKEKLESPPLLLYISPPKPHIFKN